MPQTRIVLILFFLLNLQCETLFSQAKDASNDEINIKISNAKLLYDKSDFEKSLNLSRLALSQASKNKNNNQIAYCYYIIANNYYDLSLIDKATTYYNKSIFYAIKSKDKVLVNKINNNLGNIYCFEKEQYEKGISFYKKSLQHSLKENDYHQSFLVKLNIVWAYFYMKEYEKGYPYLKSLRLNNPDNQDVSLRGTYYMLNGMYFSYKNKNELAESNFLKSIELGKTDQDLNNLSNAYLEYSTFLFNNKNYKKAFEILSEHNKLEDLIYNDEKVAKAASISSTLELDEYKREIGKIENEKDTQNQILEKSKIILWLFVLISFIFLILIVTLYKNIAFKKKTNAKLINANEELIKAKEQAEEASVLKTQFISTISHEVRTPLYGVVGITNMLLEEHKELSESTHLKSLKFSARYLLSLVNDILQINKIEENKIILENLTFNLGDEIQLVKNSLTFLAENNNNKIRLKVDENIPEYLIGDKLRLSQILMNLVSNALKFTKDGTVLVIVNLLKVENSIHFIEFIVSDNGIGIADNDQDKVFDKFVQVGRKKTDYQGTGLGLTIVKRLLELFGSEITLNSKLGEGTEFKFTLPLEYNPKLTEDIINDIQVYISSDQRYKVLVVEDNPINQLVTRKTLEKNNYSCEIVDDGFAALKLLDYAMFDIILMDINMPEMDGFETSVKIRNKGITTPIIALTAFDKEEIIEEVLAAGINDIIIKPFEPLKLFRIMNYLIVKSN